MNRFFSNRMRVIMCLVVFVLGVVIAFGGTTSENPRTTVDRLRANAAYDDQVALKAYQKRNAEIAPWVEGAAPPNQGNAALLYYQAFLFRPEPKDDTVRSKMYPGTEINKRIRTYLGYCLSVIDLVETASRMTECTWAAWPGFERELRLRVFASELGKLRAILLVDADTLAADGHYHVALQRCLTVRRLACQLSNDPNLYLFSTPSDKQALDTVRNVLSVMPPNEDVLTWFRGQFTVVQGAPPDFAKQLSTFAKAELDHIRTHHARLEMLKNLLVNSTEEEQAKDQVRKLTDEQFLLHAAAGLQRLIDSIFRIADCEMTYEQRRAEMQRLVNKETPADSTDPVTKGIISDWGRLIDQWYVDQVVHQARINGLKAAVEVYLVLAQTGRLPEKLPEYLPKDPFTGRDFVYEITDEGFALRCQGEAFLSGNNRWLEFKVRK